jgi:hypothetical protein
MPYYLAYRNHHTGCLTVIIMYGLTDGFKGIEIPEEHTLTIDLKN